MWTTESREWGNIRNQQIREKFIVMHHAEEEQTKSEWVVGLSFALCPKPNSWLIRSWMSISAFFHYLAWDSRSNNCSNNLLNKKTILYLPRRVTSTVIEASKSWAVIGQDLSSGVCPSCLRCRGKPVMRSSNRTLFPWTAGPWWQWQGTNVLRWR